ncbi:MAG: hydroxypyruvate isomerase family protein [Rhodothermales bacterium]
MSISRRSAIQKMTLAAAAMSAAPLSRGARAEPPADLNVIASINHSVCKWCYPDIELDEMAQAVKPMGITSIELLGPDDWPTLKKHGLTCAMGSGAGGIEKGWNRIENHEWLIPGFKERIQEAADAGLTNVITFSGNREGMDDGEGLENCAKGLKEIMSAAEEQNINICMELLNSKVNHPDYMCDHTVWGAKLVDAVGSDRFKLLYDIYHMQIMEGDVIRTIQDYKDYIGHYHTGGNPGRHEIDDTQELNYPAIIRAIEETGFEGYVAQEFIPVREPLASLEEAIQICNV